jgi:hypothetical protein
MTRAYSVAAIVIAAFLAALPGRLNAQNAVGVKADDIGGVVTGPHGPEAGVWVIAETHDFPTRYAKIVVTDDRGRYVVPDFAILRQDYIVAPADQAAREHIAIHLIIFNQQNDGHGLFSPGIVQLLVYQLQHRHCIVARNVPLQTFQACYACYIAVQ